MNKTGYILALLLLFMPMLPAPAQDAVTKQQRKIETYRKELAQLEKKLRDNEAKKGSAVTKLELISASVRSRKALVAESDKEIAQYNDSLTVQQARVDALQTRLDTLTAYYSKLVRNAYKNRDPKIWYMFILSSDNLGQAFRRIGVLKSLSSQMSVQAKKISEAKEELGVQMEQMRQLRTRAESVRAQRQAEVLSLQKDEAEAGRLVAQITSNSKKYRKEADAKKAEINRLNKELDKLRKELAQKAKGGSGKTGESGGTKTNKTAVDQALANEFKANRGKLPWPADGPVLTSFGSYRHPLHKNVTSLKNNGVNISMSEGEPVKSIFKGSVIKTFEMPGYGQCVVISHGDYLSLYCRLKEVSVKEGAKVTTGQAIGKIGPIMGDTYLHFEIWNSSNTAVDPEVWLK